jgi:outer membrane lipoprotein-sorting protein
MKHKSAKLAISLVLFTLALNILPVRAQVEKDILEKMIAAMGGREALSGIKDQKTTGTMEIIQFGLSVPMTIYLKEPDKFRLEMEVKGYSVVQVSNGEKAQVATLQTGDVLDLTPDQAKGMKREALGNRVWLEPDKYGITYAYRGEETVDGRKCYVLEQKFSDGDVITFFIDSSTYLPYMTRSEGIDASGGQVETENRLTDYRPVGQIMFPFAVTINQAGAEYARMKYNEVVYNTGLEDSLFVLK